MKYNKYTVTITDDYYTTDYSENKHCVEWASEYKKDFKPYYKTKKGFKTFKEAMEYVYSLETSDSVIIDDICCGEVYQSINEINTCNCCSDTKYNKWTSDNHHTTKQKDYHLPEIN